VPEHQKQRKAARFDARSWIGFAVAFLVVNIGLSLIPHTPPRQALPYTVFRDQVDAGNVSTITTVGTNVDGTLKHPLPWPPGAKTQHPVSAFTTVLPPFPDPSLWPLLLQHNVTVTSTPSGGFQLGSLLLSWFPLLVIVGLFMFLRQRMQQGQTNLFGFGKSRARRYQQDRPKVTFADVAGEEDAKDALRDVVNFLRDPLPFRALGARMPKGILLMGPPGTGKTLLARAVAGEAGCTFYSSAATEFVEMFVGVGASRVRDLFSQAKASPPAIVFIDEIDAVGRRRGAAAGPGNEEREQTLNQLLGEMDGFEPTAGVVVLAATNRPDVLDSALLRPGRFDRQVTVNLPDRPSRVAILRIHTAQIPLAPDMDLDTIARATAGFSGADLANLANEAAIVAAHRQATEVTMADFESAQDRIMMGGLTGLVMSDQERRVVAYHEAGHALAALLSPEADPVRKVSIVPRGRALGATRQVPLGEHHNYSQAYLFIRLVVLLGGRAAEELVFHEGTTGAEDDLRQATTLARQMVTQWGMSRTVGLLVPDLPEVAAGPLGVERGYSEATAARIDQETARLISDAHAQVAELLGTHHAALDRIAAALLHDDVLEPPELAVLLKEPVAAGDTLATPAAVGGPGRK